MINGFIFIGCINNLVYHYRQFKEFRYFNNIINDISVFYNISKSFKTLFI